jgi:hypothetical protein
VSDENVLFEFTLKKSEPAFLVITSEPGGAEVFLNGELKGTTPFQMRVASGEYKMELKKALYESASKLLKIKGGQTVEEKIRLIPNFGFIRITSTPSEASIEIDGKYVGNAPFTSSGLTAGEHKIALRKNLYHTHEAVVTIRQDQTLPYQATLKPAYGTLRVNSEPPGITCYLDGREIGRTPIVREQLASGRYTLRLAGDPSDMLREVIEHIVIRDGETTEQKITMPKDYGTLKIEVDSDVTIVINGDIAGAGSITRMLKAGSHRIEARKNKYNPDRRDVSIAVGETKTVRLNPSGRFGQLSVMVNPPDARDARISINGKDVGSAPKIISNLLEGTHRVEIKKEGYLPFSTAVEIKYDKMVEINPRLITYAGSRLQIRNRWKWRAVFTGLGTAACAGATLYSQKLADAAYENYGKSLYMAEAARFKKDTNQFDTYTKIGAGATGTFAVWTFYNWIRMASIRVDKNPTIRINYRILPAETIVQLSVAF